MKTLAFVLSFVLAAQISHASVVTTQLASTNVTSFTSNNAGFTGGSGATLPATVDLSSTVTPGNPPVPGVGTASTTVRIADTYNGNDLNTFTWTVTTVGAGLEIVKFDIVPITPLTSDFNFIQPPVPAGWTELRSANSLAFMSSTGLKAPGTFVFTFLVSSRDVTGSGDPLGPNTGSFTLNMAASNPEPGSLALCGLASVIAGGFGWRRRKSASVKVDEFPPLEV